MTEADTDSLSGTPSDSTAGSVEAPRRCLACGYDLRGLGEDLRCPECGLRNIPSAYRQQVWDLVDSGRWFFSGFFTPFRKRLPGWWWALDRPGDVRRSVRFAACHALISTVLLLGFALAADSVLVETTTVSRFSYRSSGQLYRTGQLGTLTFRASEYVTAIGVFGLPRYRRSRDVSDKYANSLPAKLPAPTVRIVFIRPSAASVYDALHLLHLWSWGLLIWGIPAAVGLCTQIRKGLPQFARAPRTILAAANYEAHRITYFATLWAGVFSIQFLLRWSFPAADIFNGNLSEWILLPGALYGMLGWAGPLRSDYTAQLIRSRWHGFRIALMYALALPAALAFALIQGLKLLAPP
ncbi:MAG: hypothetical protein IID37_00600 [Planctomycetes bacterium]|nr:hypothetical protein [Planctomycetota bacterium]